MKVSIKPRYKALINVQDRKRYRINADQHQFTKRNIFKDLKYNNFVELSK